MHSKVFQFKNSQSVRCGKIRKHFALQLIGFAFAPILTVHTHTRKLFLPFLCSDFKRLSQTKGTENMHRWDKKGSGRGRAAHGTAPPRCGFPLPHLRNHCPPHLHPPVAAREPIFRPVTLHPHLGQPLGIVWSLQRPRKKGKEEREKKRREDQRE